MSERVTEEMEALLTKYRNALVPDVFAFVEAFASDVTAALASPAAAPRDETGWLIELPRSGSHGNPTWWCGHRADPQMKVWSETAGDAVRFTRKQDAENTLRIITHYIEMVGGSRWGYDSEPIVTEHAWMSGIALAHPPAAAQDREDAAKDAIYARTAIEDACRIIERGDERLLRLDGPCNNLPPDITLAEWRAMYVALDNARKRLWKSTALNAARAAGATDGK